MEQSYDWALSTETDAMFPPREGSPPNIFESFLSLHMKLSLDTPKDSELVME